jgi:hypothetical protein
MNLCPGQSWLQNNKLLMRMRDQTADFFVFSRLIAPDRS